jgi:four helix bundle protein
MKRAHHNLMAWQQSIALVKSVYQLTSSFPKTEIFGLIAQMRRAAISVPSNIAEGAARATDKEFLHFLHVARGSLSELETQLIISRDLGYAVNDAVIDELIQNIFANIGGLIRAKKATL